MGYPPSGSSKRVSRRMRWKVGSLVPEISLSVMMTWESSVSHSPGPSCGVEIEWRAPRSPFLAPQPQHAGSGPSQDGEGSAWPKGQLGVAQVPWGSAGRWLCPAPYLIGLPDGPEGDPHRAHHGVPDEPLVPHLHGQAQVQSIDLTGDRKGIRLSTTKLTPLRLPLLNSPLGPPQLLPVPSGPGLR